jgi:hypothetical protein
MTDAIDLADTETCAGLVYLRNSDDPYSGDAFSLWPNGKKSMEKTFKDGLTEGTCTA